MSLQINASFCRKNVRGKTDVRCDGLYCTDFEACFKISDSLQWKISERCRKAVTEFRKNRRDLFKLSMITLLTQKRVLKVIDEAQTNKKLRKFISKYFFTAHWKSAQSKAKPPKKGLPCKGRCKLRHQLQMTAADL